MTPSSFCPTIDNVTAEWRPYVLAGRRQTDVPQQSWIDYEIEAHKQGAVMLADDSVPIETYKIKQDWDKAFLAKYCAGDLSVFRRLVAEGCRRGGRNRRHGNLELDRGGGGDEIRHRRGAPGIVS